MVVGMSLAAASFFTAAILNVVIEVCRLRLCPTPVHTDSAHPTTLCRKKITHNVNKLKFILIILAYYSLKVIGFNCVHHFPPHLVCNYFTLQFITITDMTLSHIIAISIRMPFNKYGILILKSYLLKGYTACCECREWCDAVVGEGREFTRVQFKDSSHQLVCVFR